MTPRRPADRNRTFEERLQPPKRPGYSAVPVVVGWIGVLLVTASAADSSMALLAAGLALGAVAVGTGLPALVGRVETVVEDGDLFVTLGPAWLSGGEHVRLDAGRIGPVEVVENPVSDPPTDGEGDPLPGFDGEGQNARPDASVGIPDRPGVVIRVEDGPAPEFPVVVPGEGFGSAFSTGRGPPGFVPSDRPEDLWRALAAARAGPAGESNPTGPPPTSDRRGTAEHGTTDRLEAAESGERGR